VLFNESRDSQPVIEEPATSEYNETNRKTSRLKEQFQRPIADLELSVRARNCLDGANVTTIGELITLSENEVINLKNLGKTSLTEIKTKLAEMGLSLGMQA
jgi:DNA-directed RNA polymerase subunit alpha